MCFLGRPWMELVMWLWGPYLDSEICWIWTRADRVNWLSLGSLKRREQRKWGGYSLCSSSGGWHEPRSSSWKDRPKGYLESGHETYSSQVGYGGRGMSAWLWGPYFDNCGLRMGPRYESPYNFLQYTFYFVQYIIYIYVLFPCNVCSLRTYFPFAYNKWLLIPEVLKNCSGTGSCRSSL